MGFFKKLFAGKQVVVDPADLTLPDTIPTSQSGLTLRKGPSDVEVRIEIVGERYKAENVAALAVAAAGKPFDIYLVAEPQNPHDRNAVGVWAGTVQVGYIPKPDNKQWFTWVNEATKRGDLLWGRGRCSSRDGTQNIGVFGSIYMPRVGKGGGDLLAKRLTPVGMQKAADKVIALWNAVDEPETVTQLRSVCKKAVTAATPLAAHAKWVAENPEGQNTQVWGHVEDLCGDIFEAAEDATYATDAGDVDPLSGILELADYVKKEVLPLAAGGEASP